jgi:hypothetical protein
MKGFTEAIRKGEKTVCRISVIRKFREVRDKRARDGEFDTRPWNVDELIA